MASPTAGSAVGAGAVPSEEQAGAVIARFAAERQALAMMDHPNIAKVLDAAAKMRRALRAWQSIRDGSRPAAEYGSLADRPPLPRRALKAMRR